VPQVTEVPELLRVGTDRFRIVPRHGDQRVALISPLPGTVPPDAEAVRRCVAVLRDRGVTEVVTGALARVEVPAFVEAGFALREHLHLLVHDLTVLPRAPATPGVRLRRARRSDRADVLGVDGAAFDAFWHLDQIALADALDATPSRRFRVAVDPAVVGYLVTGRSAGRGYLQRLGVDPAHQRQGIATALVLDGLGWLARHGASQAIVNTQEHNTAALALYTRLGFRREPHGLSVLARSTADL
jgi:ribosomal-protein-alanine N-acetyltransferase